MCLGVPGRITEVWQEGGAPMAHADFAGTVRRVCLAYLPELTVGDFVITHMGYALTKISEADAAATLSMMRQYGVLDAVPGEPHALPGATAAVPGEPHAVPGATAPAVTTTEPAHSAGTP